MNLGRLSRVIVSMKKGEQSVYYKKHAPISYHSVSAKTMEEDFLRDHPELRPFVLSDVQLTGTTIGGGAYGQVEEVAFPVEAAAKTIHAILQGGPNELSKAVAEFVRECQLMSTVRHPNVVQFLGVAFFPGSLSLSLSPSALTH